MRFTSTKPRARRGIRLHGEVEAAGEQIPLELVAALQVVDGELEVEAVTYVDQRRLDMTLSPLGMVRSPASCSSARASCVSDGSAQDRISARTPAATIIRPINPASNWPPP